MKKESKDYNNQEINIQSKHKLEPGDKDERSFISEEFWSKIFDRKNPRSFQELLAIDPKIDETQTRTILKIIRDSNAEISRIPSSSIKLMEEGLS